MNLLGHFLTVGGVNTLFAITSGLLMLGAVSAKEYTIAVIPKGTTHEFWKSIHAGAVKAEQELAAKGTVVKLFWKGPLREDDREQQIQVVENFTTRRVSGIVLAPLDSHALVNPVRSAVRAKIPVVVMDSDLKSDQYVSFVATDNFLGGQLAGEQLAKLLEGRGNVILLRYAVGSASTEAREAGFLDALKKHPGIVLIGGSVRGADSRDGVPGVTEPPQSVWQPGEWNFLPGRAAHHCDGQGSARHWQGGREGQDGRF